MTMDNRSFITEVAERIGQMVRAESEKPLSKDEEELLSCLLLFGIEVYAKTMDCLDAVTERADMEIKRMQDAEVARPYDA